MYCKKKLQNDQKVIKIVLFSTHLSIRKDDYEACYNDAKLTVTVNKLILIFK